MTPATRDRKPHNQPRSFRSSEGVSDRYCVTYTGSQAPPARSEFVIWLTIVERERFAVATVEVAPLLAAPPVKEADESVETLRFRSASRPSLSVVMQSRESPLASPPRQYHCG